MTEPISPSLPKPQPRAHIQPRPGPEHRPRPLEPPVAEPATPATHPTPEVMLREAPGARGKTAVADAVVAKIAGMAAREVGGIHAMGGGFARGYGAMRDRVPGTGTDVGRGVKVEVGEKQTAIDLGVVVDYGVSIADVAAQVRNNVAETVERMTGLEVVAVNIAIHDVYLLDDGAAEKAAPRVH